MKKFILTVLLSVLLIPTTSADIKPPADKFENTLWHATFALYGEYEGKRAFLCTTTAFEKTDTGYDLLGAGHCVIDERLPKDLKFYVAEEMFDVTGDVAPKELQQVSVIKAWRDDDKGIDFAVFHLITTKAYPVIALGDESELSVGSGVVVVNFAGAVGKQLSRGTISSQMLPNKGGDAQCDICLLNFMVQYYGGSGASGSARTKSSA